MPKRRKKKKRRLRKKLRKKLKKEEEDNNLVFFIKNASHNDLRVRGVFLFFYIFLQLSEIGSSTGNSFSLILSWFRWLLILTN